MWGSVLVLAATPASPCHTASPTEFCSDYSQPTPTLCQTLPVSRLLPSRLGPALVLCNGHLKICVDLEPVRRRVCWWWRVGVGGCWGQEVNVGKVHVNHPMFVASRSARPNLQPC